MATTNLPDYLKLIDQLLEDGRFYEASQHCRQILQQYPRHIPTYRALAKALLEQRQYSNASDLFHRILSADPHDFIAHVGLALIHREEQHIPQATWHMQRAFELAPYNGAIQEELQGLYAAQNRRVKQTITPNRCALAHLYLRSELYAMAVTELQSLKQEEAYAGRIDLDVLLAEAFWRNGQHIEAVSTCLKVLEKLPNCIQANAILAEIWLLTGRLDEAQTYFQRLQALLLPSKTDLDAETAVGRAFCTPGAPPLPEQTSVTSLDSLTAVTDSVGSSAADLEQDTTDEESQDDLYDWLQALQAPEDKVTDQGAKKHTPDKGENWLAAKPGPAPSTPEEDWLTELDSIPLPELRPAPQVGSAAQPDIPLEEIPEEPIAPIAKMPTWLLAGDDGSTDLDADSAADWLKLDEMDDSDISIQVVVEDQTDWFSDPSQPRIKPQTDWFVDQSASGYESQHEAATEGDSGAQADAGWLAELEETMQPARVETAELDEWLTFTDELDRLSQAALTSEELPLAEATATPAKEDEEIPQWLMTAPLAGESVSEESAEFADSGMPHWLMTGPLETAVDAAPAAETFRDDEADDLVAWLAEATTTPSPVEEAVEPLDLSQLLATSGLATSDLSGGQETLPEWLHEGEPSDWLSEETEAETEDEFVDALFGNLPLDLMGDDEDASPQDSAIPTDTGSDLPATPLWGSAGEALTFAEETDSSELPSWLFSNTWGDSDKLVSDTGSVGLDELIQQPGLVNGELHAENVSPDWLASTDSIGEERVEVEPPSTGASLSFREESEAVDEREDFAALADLEMTADVPLQKRSSGLLDWLSDMSVDTGEMEALTMADMDEMASLESESEDAQNLAGADELDETEWLQELATAPGPEELGAGAMLEPAELPDWLQSLTGSLPKGEPAVPFLDDLIQEEEAVADRVTGATSMLDWLQGDEAIADAGAAAEVTPNEFELDLEGDNELPSSEMNWLGELFAEQAKASPPLSQAPESDWDFAQPAMDEPGEDEADSFDWQQELDTAPEPELPGTAAEADYIWLADLETPLELETAVELDEEVTDDWLAELRELPTTDDWLAEAAPGKETALDEMEFAPNALEETPVTGWQDELIPERAEIHSDLFTEEGEKEDVLAWLDSLILEKSGETELAATVPAATSSETITSLTDEEVEDEGEALAWLGDLVEEPASPPVAEPEEGVVAMADAQAPPALDAAQVMAVQADAEAELPEIVFPEDAMFPRNVGVPTDVPEELDDTMAWLAELVAEQGLSLDDLTPEPVKMAEETAVPLVPEPAAAPSAEIDDAMAWLDQLAEEQGMPIEALPTVADRVLAEVEKPVAATELAAAELAAPAQEVEVEAADELAFILDWLAEMALVSTTEITLAPDIQAVAPAATDLLSALDWVEQQLRITAAAPLKLDINIDEIPEDPEMALAWLAGMAEVETEAPPVIEKETAVSTTPLPDTQELVDLTLVDDIPDDPEAAVRWLEELAVDEPPMTPPLHEVEAKTAIVLPATGELPELVFPEDAMFPRDVGVPTDVPEELEDSMDWLQALMAEQGLSLDELDTETAVAPAPEEIAEPPIAPEALAEPVIARDEALSAWATEAEATVESELDASVPVALPESAPAESQTNTAVAEAGELNLDFLLESEPGTLSWLDEFATEEKEVPPTKANLEAALGIEEEPDSTVREILSELESEFDIRAELSDSWPEWLSVDQEGTPGLGETGWLKSFGETDVSSWLTAEDEIMSSGIFEDISLPSVKFPAAAPFEAGEPPEIPSVFGDVSTLSAASHLPADGEQLRVAQAAIKAGDLNTAMQSYQQLIETGSGLGPIIADLETAVKQNPHHAALRRLLGDAYMRNGQLQKALDTYRQALSLI